jgi:hypothetical protein
MPEMKKPPPFQGAVFSLRIVNYELRAVFYGDLDFADNFANFFGVFE